jgi:hypothetical protein
MSLKRFATAALALGVLALVLAPTAAAHKTTFSSDGKIKIVWGFLNEPAVTYTKTGLDLALTDNATGAPITGAAETLEAHLKWGEQEHEFEDLRAQVGKPGSYTDVITLTQPGLYTLVLHGTINGTQVDLEIPGAHEIHGIDETFFPAPASNPFGGASGSTAALEQEIAALKTRLAALEAKTSTQAATPATVTDQANGVPAPGLLVVALGLVAAALVLRRRA